MPRLTEKLLVLAALAAVAVGCKPKIGDDCKISTDCSAAGDRLCDITQPGGYCTVYNCEPGTCPVKESLCVEFGAQRSPAKACQDRQSPSPYGRAFCMATCEKDSDCRSGYVCSDLSATDENGTPTNPWGALLIDTDRGNRACMVPVTNASFTEGGSSFGDVCTSELPAASGGSSGGGGGSGGSSNGGASSGGQSGNPDAAGAPAGGVGEAASGQGGVGG